MRIVTDYKHAQQIIIELDARIAKLEAEKEHLADVAEDHIDVTEIHRKRIAELEADATCWTHGMNREGTTGGMYLKANCPDCKALEGEGK